MKRKKKWGIIAIILSSFLMVLGCNNADDSKASNEIQAYWWGSQSLHDRTNELINQFNNDHHDIKVSSSFSGWDGYWDKLMTQVSGGSEPDVFLMSSRYLKQYASKDVLMDLDNTDIDFHSFDEKSLETGKVNGKIYAIPTGMNTRIMVYNQDMLKEAGVTVHKDGRLTWDEFSELTRKISKQLPDDEYGTQNEMGSWDQFQYYTRDRGEQLYSEDGKSLGFSKQTMTDWFNYWLELQEDGATPPAEVTSSYKGGEYDKYPIVQGRAAMGFDWNNEYTKINNLNDDNMKMTLSPRMDNGTKPDYLHASAYWVISKDTKHPKASVKLLKFLTSDPRVGKSFRTDRGVPIQKSIKKNIKKTADHDEKQQLSIIDQAGKKSGETPTLAPSVEGHLNDLMQDTSEAVLFKQITPEEGTKAFFDTAESIMSRG